MKERTDTLTLPVNTFWYNAIVNEGWRIEYRQASKHWLSRTNNPNLTKVKIILGYGKKAKYSTFELKSITQELLINHPHWGVDTKVDTLVITLGDEICEKS